MRFCWIWRGRGSEEFRSRLTSFGRDVAALRLRAASCEPALAHSRRHRRNPSVPSVSICGQPQAGLPAQRGGSSKELRVASLPSRTAEGTGATHLCHLCPSVDNPRRACPPNEWEAQKSCEFRACPRAQPKAQAQPICVHLWTTPGGPARPTRGKLKRAASFEPALAHSRRHRRNPSVPSVSICGQPQADLPAQRGESSKELRVSSLPSRTAEGTGATHLCPSVDNSRRACPPNEWEAQKSCELRACPRAQPKAQAQPICAICVHLWTTPGGPARPTRGKLKRVASCELRACPRA
jgi:hypothetical protein